MTVPQEYWNASKDFDRFLADVRDTCMLQTHNQAYHTLRAVLHVFRAHLTLAEGLAFAEVLPPVTRAIFVEGWEVPEGEPAPFPSRDALQSEVKAIRRDHNMAPDTAIADVASALRRSSIDTRALDRVLNQMSEGARAFWAVDGHGAAS